MGRFSVATTAIVLAVGCSTTFESTPGPSVGGAGGGDSGAAVGGSAGNSSSGGAGGTTTSGGADGSGGAAVQTCDEQYGHWPGYELCEETIGFCRFAADTSFTFSCGEICGDGGGNCIGGTYNENKCAEPGAMISCGVTNQADGICICSRGSS